MTTNSRIPDLIAARIMTSPVVACREDAYFEEVADLLAERDISGVPVVDGAGRLTGVISERDLAHVLGGPLVRLAVRRPVLRRHVTVAVSDLPREARRARDIMTTDPITAQPDTPTHTLAEIMLKEQINRVPIVHAGRLVGIVTRGDVLGAVSGLNHHEISLEEPPSLVGVGSEGGFTPNPLASPPRPWGLGS